MILILAKSLLRGLEMTQKENEVKEKYTLYSWTKWIDLVKSQPNHIVFIENTPKEVFYEHRYNF